jgi:hypothetical protein
VSNFRRRAAETAWASALIADDRHRLLGEARQVFSDAIGEPDLAFFDEHQHGRRGHRLRHGCQAEDRVGAHRRSGLDEPGIAAEVLENPFDDRRRLDAGDDVQPAAAAAADLDVDGEQTRSTSRICRTSCIRARS